MVGPAHNTTNTFRYFTNIWRKCKMSWTQQITNTTHQNLLSHDGIGWLH